MPQSNFVNSCGSECNNSKIKLISERHEQLIEKAVQIEQEDAKAAGMIGYMTRAMVQASMPYRDPKTAYFERKNGYLTLTMSALDPDIGLPYGSIPRLVLAWIGSEAVKTKDRTLVLGSSLSDFLKELGLYRTGGKRGDITRLRNQMVKLFSAAISANYGDPKKKAGNNMLIADEYNLWWNNKGIAQTNFWESTVKLGQPLFEELINAAVPVDMRALKALKSTPMAIDIYTWLTHRNYYLRKDTLIPWKSLQMQFGSDYADTRQGKNDFKRAMISALKKTLIVYSQAKVSVEDRGLALKPSPTHITR